MAKTDIIYPFDFTILIVDDDTEVLEQYKDILKDNDYDDVLTATSGIEAIEIIKNQTVNVLIIDFFMPNMDGQETIAKIREFNSEIVIIVQTGFSGDKPAIELLKYIDIQGYYDKSEDISKLLLWVAVGIRISTQMKKIKGMVNELNTANESLNAMMQNQAWLIQQVRLASLGQKMGSIFHDMATPKLCMSSSLNYIPTIIDNIEEMINRDTLPKEEIIKNLAEIKEECKSNLKHVSYISDVMNAVISQSRQEKVSKWQTFTLENIFKKIQFFATADTRKKHCSFKIDNLITREVNFYGSEINLVQVILNLIANSAQAYEIKDIEQGKIDLVITQSEDNIIFSVADNAGGIPKEVQDKLLKEMVTTKDQGNGIGLYSSYLIIKDYFKGKMWFESEEGVGTTFFVSIPYAVK